MTLPSPSLWSNRHQYSQKMLYRYPYFIEYFKNSVRSLHMDCTSDLVDIKLRHSKTETRSIVATLSSTSNMSQSFYSYMSCIAQVFLPFSHLSPSCQ